MGGVREKGEVKKSRAGESKFELGKPDTPPADPALSHRGSLPCLSRYGKDKQRSMSHGKLEITARTAAVSRRRSSSALAVAWGMDGLTPASGK